MNPLLAAFQDEMAKIARLGPPNNLGKAADRSRQSGHLKAAAKVTPEQAMNMLRGAGFLGGGVYLGKKTLSPQTQVPAKTAGLRRGNPILNLRRGSRRRALLNVRRVSG